MGDTRTGTWTPERIKQLKELCDQDVPRSFTEIAIEMGLKRNAIVGRMNRDGLVLPSVRLARVAGAPLKARRGGRAIMEQARARTEAVKAAQQAKPKPVVIVHEPTQEEKAERLVKMTIMVPTPLIELTVDIPPEAPIDSKAPLATEIIDLPAWRPAALPLARRSGAGPAIMALRDYHCRWPEGDPCKDDFHFCSAPTDVDQPYCSHHNSIARVPYVSRSSHSTSQGQTNSGIGAKVRSEA